jgi:hypothetical protein
MNDSEPVPRGKTRRSKVRRDSIASLLLERARLYRLRKNSDSRRFWEGHDFSRAVKSLKMCPPFSARGMLFTRRRFSPRPLQSCHMYRRISEQLDGFFNSRFPRTELLGTIYGVYLLTGTTGGSTLSIPGSFNPPFFREATTERKQG